MTSEKIKEIYPDLKDIKTSVRECLYKMILGNWKNDTINKNVGFCNAEPFEHIVIDNFFERIEDAIDYAANCGAHTTKVYNPDGELVHVRTPDAVETYA